MPHLTDRDRREMAERKEMRHKKKRKKQNAARSKTQKKNWRSRSATEREEHRLKIQESQRKRLHGSDEVSDSPATQELAHRELCRRHLLPYIKRFNPDYLAGWVHKDICHRFEKFFHLIQQRQSPRMMLMVPPRHGKSTISSMEFPSWALGNDPNLEIIASSYAIDLPRGFSRQVRDRIQHEPEYNLIFPETQLATDSRGLEEWRLQRPLKGRFQAVGVGGPITGKGADCFPAGTMISTPQGPRQIQTLEAGDEVWSYDFEKQENFVSYVEASREKTATDFVTLKTVAGTQLRATNDHRVYSLIRGWVKAEDVYEGETLVIEVGIDSVAEKMYRRYVDGGEPVYDIQVARGHCFFAEEILVHNCFIIDDPVKNREEADSLVIQESTWKWYTSTAYTRLSPGGGIIVVLTRWSEQDLGGKVVDNARKSGEEWDIIRYPALAEDVEYYDTRKKLIHVGPLPEDLPDNRRPDYKPLRNQGDALHPARYDEKALKRIRETVGPRDWSALYQQRPVPEQGDYIKSKWFRYYTPLSYDGMKHVQAWDLAIGKNDQNNYTVGVTLAIDWDGRVHVRDVVRGRWGTYEIAEHVLRKHIEYDSQLVGIEHGHIFLAVEEDLRKLEKKYRIRPTYDDTLKPIHDKHVRARPMQGMFQGGDIIFPEDAQSRWPWLIEELLKFPALGRDDGFDAMAWGCRMLPNITPPKRGPHANKQKSWKEQLKQYRTGAGSGGNHLLA